MKAFRAVPNGTIRLQANTAAGAAPLLAGFPAGSGNQVRMWNRGSVAVSVEFGAHITMPLPVAPAGGAPGAQSLPPGAVEVQSLQSDQRHVAILVTSGAPDIEFTIGEGI
ncbi:hypothetical protein [Methylobacterium sp. E-045]|uniref:hypothetical protein n=1 Tax=Methylobacterium sp. E-045 TaxID=2836575 RepID=UPI001FB972DE|nr:hypothetical protein [Methylobacterium sp. E-045]MCJ2129227.1 hypothetical protein [Methylobacterium sp. E-045]